MAESNSTANRRLIQIKDILTMNKTAMEPPWDPNSTIFPTRHRLPTLPNAPKGAAWVWGKDDFLGRLNLLTPTRVLVAKQSIKTGDLLPVNLPLTVPSHPAFGREPFRHTIKPLRPGFAYDDLYALNTQSGTQWDGFRHYVHPPSRLFYNGTTAADIDGPAANENCSIHHWAEHGIAGRGVLLDFKTYADRKGIEFDAFDRFEISYAQLAACGQEQGIDIRPAAQGGDVKVGDMLFVRMGWTAAYDALTAEQRQALGEPDTPTRFVGLKQEDAVLDWLHDGYFAAVAGDAPSFEAWPVQGPYSLHEHILALWGMPLGEMLDLEGLAGRCRELGRWFFFFTSAPANVPRGVSSHVNGLAIL